MVQTTSDCIELQLKKHQQKKSNTYAQSMTNKPLTPIRDKKPYRDNKPCNTYKKI